MYDHYIALDWAQSNMAIARLSKQAKKLSSVDQKSDILDLKAYLKSLAGKKILTIEEGSTAQWLFVELHECVDKILICDPRRNRLLSEGAKTDKVDAIKLVKLLKSGLLKEVYHTTDQFIYLRKIVSGYEDLIKAGVRFKNQRSALYRCNGQNIGDTPSFNDAEKFVLRGLEKSVEMYEEEKKLYREEISKLCKQHKILKNLKSIPGIDDIGAIKIAARVVNPRRFPTKGKFLSFCGLVKHDKMSGGRSYGKRQSAYNRELKNVFDTAAITCIVKNRKNFLKKRYDYLTIEKRFPDHQARRAISRYTAVLALGVMKSGTPFKSRRLEEKDALEK